jgi:hypothetical protein
VKPPARLIDYWVVIGASVASVTTPFLRHAQPNDLWRVGMENPAIRAVLIWGVAVTGQYVAWWIFAGCRAYILAGLTRPARSAHSSQRAPTEVGRDSQRAHEITSRHSNLRAVSATAERASSRWPERFFLERSG